MNAIQRLNIFYFSGTGNAKRIAVWLSELATQRNMDCQLFRIDETDATSINTIHPDDLIIIISPVHGFNFPKITLDFIRSFPKGKNRLVLMNTRAGMRIGHWVTPGLSGMAFMLSSFLLKRKGYQIVGQIPFDMPSNWISVHPALNEKTVKFLHETNYRRVERHADRIFSGKPDFLARKDLFQDILISPVALGYYWVGRFVFAKSFYATAACNQCELCEKQCPVHAIKYSDTQPFWTFRCESCMKCMNTCPQRAIETTHGLWIVAVVLSSIATGLLYGILAHMIQSGFVKFILFNVILVVLMWLLYLIQRVLLRNKRIGKWITFTSLTHYKCWGRYLSIPDSKWKKK